MELLGKVALVTGGANGIGRAFARALAREGADVVIADLDGARLEQARLELVELYARGRLHAVRFDVRKDAQVRSVVAEAIAEMGRVDILVNAAGVLLLGDLDHLVQRDWTWMLQTNLLGAVRTVNALAPHLVERGSGHVVNVVAFGGLVPQGPPSIAYDSGEAAIVAFSEGVALQLRPHGVGVTVLCTGRGGPRPGQNTRVRGMPGIRGWLPRSGVNGSDDGSHGLEDLEQLLVDALRSERFLALADADQRLLRARWRDLDADLSRRLEAAVSPES
jgi:NAD(P)-dependent dehydrogenase (short-subunit alcohol dehydrogenase family)